MLILQNKSGSGTPPGGGVSTPDCTAPHVFDNTYWTNVSDMFWNGTYWIVTGGINFTLGVTGTWATGYRPTSMELKVFKDSSGINDPTWEFRVYDTDNNDISGNIDLTGIALDTVVDVSVPLTFQGFDIDRIQGGQFLYNNGAQFRCIKFL